MLETYILRLVPFFLIIM